MKKYLVSFFSLLSIFFMLSAQAEPSQAAIQRYIQFTNQAQTVAGQCQPVTISDPNFCSDFVTNTLCQCNNHDPKPPFACTMANIYGYIVKNLGYEMACKQSSNKNPQDCVHDWQCYMTGHYLVGSTPMPCPHVNVGGCPGHP